MGRRNRCGFLAFSAILLLLCSCSVVKSVEVDGLRQSEMEAVEEVEDLEKKEGDSDSDSSDGNAEEEWDGFESSEDDFPAGNEYGGLEEEEEEEGEEGEGEGEGEGDVDPDVSILSVGNFTEFISREAYAMVAFVAPWCGLHCKALAPEFSAAATHLKASNKNVSFAKVDATQDPQLSQHYNVQSYPTLLFFIHGHPTTYSLLSNR